MVEKGDLSAGRLAGFWHRVTFTVEKDKSLVGSEDAGDSSAVVESCQKSVQVAGLEFFPDLAHRGCHVPAGCLPEPNALASGVVVLGLGVGGLGQAAFCQCPTLARTAHSRDRSVFSGRDQFTGFLRPDRFRFRVDRLNW